MTKSPSKKVLKNKADKLWSAKVKESAGSRCECCAKPTGLNSHHIISRSNHKLRFDLRNGCCLCVACHFWAHQSGIEFAYWFQKRRKDDHAYLLKQRYVLSTPLGIKEYEDIIANLGG